MTVIVLHQADELKLIDFQKKLIENTKGGWYAHIPLWIELPDIFCAKNKDDLKKLSKQISKVKVGRVCHSDENSDLIYANITIFDKNDNAFFARLPLLHRLSGKSRCAKDFPDTKENDFACPLSKIKIFRLGIEKETDAFEKSRHLNSQNILNVQLRALTDSIWVKLHDSASSVE